MTCSRGTLNSAENRFGIGGGGEIRELHITALLTSWWEGQLLRVIKRGINPLIVDRLFPGSHALGGWCGNWSIILDN